MKTWTLCAFLVACGGTDSAIIPDASDDGGTGNDGTTGNDATGSDGASTDGTTTGDGASTDGTTIDTGTFNPANVNGLVLWLEADVSASVVQSNGRVTQWKDQTSHHNDAYGSTQSTTQGRNPTLKGGQINGVDALHFNKGSPNQSANILVVTDNSDKSLQWGTSDFFVAIVGEFDNDPKDTNGQNFAVGNFFSKNFSPSVNSFTGVAFYGNLPMSGNTTSTGLLFMTSNALNDFAYTATAYNDNKPHAFAIRRKGNTIDLYVDGTSINSATTTTNVDVSNASVPCRIGADGDASLVRLDGDIGEIYAVEGALSSSDQASIQAYLKKKWGTP
jgi:hypothetical protein